MLSRILGRLDRYQFDTQSRSILQTPPIRLKPSAPLRVVSMVRGRDLYMYLAAVKSLFAAIGEGGVIVINDGSMDSSSEDVIRGHLQGVEIMSITAINTGRCPRGGTWERLVLIHELTAKNYVIQMDADTLARDELVAVNDFYQRNVSFGLGTTVGQAVVPATDISVWAAEKMIGVASVDITIAAESLLKDLPDASKLKYIRGSSGFAGFARGAFSLAKLEAFSLSMEKLLGPRWLEWGTEQVSSNFSVANAPDAVVLPFPSYSCYYPENGVNYKQNAFVHFIGTHRYQNGFYRSEVKNLVERLAKN